jgi:GTPase SAR1 family protein
MPSVDFFNCVLNIQLRYLIAAPMSRWTEGDTEVVRDALKDIPVVVVLNKCDIATDEQIVDLESTILKYGLANVKGVFKHIVQ